MENKEAESERTYFAVLFKKEDQDHIKEWWKWLHDSANKGARAELRRCESPQAVLTKRAFHRLANKLSYWENQHLIGLATVAGILAVAKNSEKASFAKLLGEAKEGADKPIFSEMRFQKLTTSTDANDFYKGLRRAVIQVGEKANPILLADGILHWFKEQDKPEDYQGKKSWKYHWAKDYYSSKVFTKGAKK